MARILLVANYRFSESQLNWFRDCPGGCFEKHEFVFSQSGRYDLVCVFNWSSSFLWVRAPKNRFVKVVQEPNWPGRFSHRFVNHHPRVFSKIRGHAAARDRLHKGQVFELSHSFLPPHVSSSTDLPRKTKLFSIIASTQAQLPGQQRRNQVVNELLERRRELKEHAFGRGRNEISSKTQGLDSYMYSLAVENSSIPGYFTEKFTDPIMRGVVPVYFGAPDISEYFPKDSYIQLAELNADSIERALDGLSVDDYERRVEYLAEAQKVLNFDMRPCCWLSEQISSTRPDRDRRWVAGIGLGELTSRLRVYLGKRFQSLFS